MPDFNEILTFANLAAFLTLTALEVVLGIDNIVFIAILTGKLDPAVRAKARRLGLAGALIMRILLLLTITAIMQLDKTILFAVFGHDFTVKDLILFVGGLFLIAKATWEIHDKLESPKEDDSGPTRRAASFASAIGQIMLLDMVFSIDSVITAVGMTPYVGVMVTAVLVSIGVMLFASKSIYAFINQHPTVKMLALAFLLLIGVTLIAEGLGQKLPKGYVYAAIAFSVLVEMLNIRTRKRPSAPVELHEKMRP